MLGKTALLIIPTHTGGEDLSSCSAGKATLPPSPHSILESGYMFHGLHGLFITAVGKILIWPLKFSLLLDQVSQTAHFWLIDVDRM